MGSLILDIPGIYNITFPASITMCWASVLGAGAGGNSQAPSGGLGQASGGSGEFCDAKQVIIPSGGLVVVVGAGGLGGVLGSLNGKAGGLSSVGEIIALGAKALPGSTNVGGVGGGPRGGVGAIPGIFATWGSLEGPKHVGGGGGGGQAGGGPFPPEGAPGTDLIASGGVTGPVGQRGCGGASSEFGIGGDGGNSTTVSPTEDGKDGIALGSGGGGSGSHGFPPNTNSIVGGDGGNGRVALTWCGADTDVLTIVANSDIIVQPGVGSIVVVGQTPAVLERFFRIPQGTIAITGLAPTVDTLKKALPGVGSVVITGRAPTAVNSGKVALPGVGAIGITGRAPTHIQ
jgi:hypothetical protein